MKVFLSLALMNIVVSAHKLYPNLTCHDGYQKKDHVIEIDGQTKHSPGGDFYLKKIHDQCRKQQKNDKHFCLKRCILEKLHVPNIMTSLKADTFKDMELFFNPVEKGIKLAKKLKDVCKEKYKSVELREPCEDWSPFFECVDNIFDDCK